MLHAPPNRRQPRYRGHPRRQTIVAVTVGETLRTGDAAAPRPLLCAVHRWKEAQEAADVAARLGERLAAPVVLARVLPQHAEQPRGSESDLLVRVAEESGFDRPPRARLTRGDPAEKIVALADEEDARLVIVGSRGRGALRSAVLGSVSSRVADRSRRPVLVVAPGASRAFRLSLSERAPSIVCGVDDSDAAKLAARHAAALARSLGLRLVLVNVYGDRRRALSPAGSGALPHYGAVALDAERRSASEALHDVAKLIGPGLDPELKLVRDELPRALAHRADRDRALFVVVGSRSRTPLTSALLGSGWKPVAASARCPVMVVPELALEPEPAPCASAVRATEE
jgi:nucleotide-binding universal stress UspA family protein